VVLITEHTVLIAGLAFLNTDNVVLITDHVVSITDHVVLIADYAKFSPKNFYKDSFKCDIS